MQIKYIFFACKYLFSNYVSPLIFLPLFSTSQNVVMQQFRIPRVKYISSIVLEKMLNFLHALVSMKTSFPKYYLFNQISRSCLQVSRSLRLSSCYITSIIWRWNAGTLALVLSSEQGQGHLHGEWSFSCPPPSSEGRIGLTGQRAIAASWLWTGLPPSRMCLRIASFSQVQNLKGSQFW